MGANGEFDIDPNLEGSGEFHVGDDGSFQKCGVCCPCPEECPCTSQEWSGLYNNGTPCGGLVKCYRIDGYTDGDLSACDDCNSSSDAAWDGSVTASVLRCRWAEEGSRSIDGKKFHMAVLNWFATADCWRLEIYCLEGADTTHLIWDGSKTAGYTPVGEYSRLGGCDQTSSLRLVEKTC